MTADESFPDAAALIAILEDWPDGYREGIYGGARWGATLTREAAGKKLTLYARETGGADFVSGNFYLLASGAAARPCEMPLEKMAAFIRGFSPDRA